MCDRGSEVFLACAFSHTPVPPLEREREMIGHISHDHESDVFNKYNSMV